MVLWKKGYFTNRDSLPSLHNFEINVLLAKFFYYRKNLSAENQKVIPFITESIRIFLEKTDVLDQAFLGLKEQGNILILEEDLNKEFKEKNFKEKQTSLLFMYDLLCDHLFPYLIKFPFEDYGYLAEYDVLIDAIIDYLPKSNVLGFFKFKCLKCCECSECETRNTKIKKDISLEEVLKKLIKLKTSNCLAS